MVWSCSEFAIRNSRFAIHENTAWLWQHVMAKKKASMAISSWAARYVPLGSSRVRAQSSSSNEVRAQRTDTRGPKHSSILRHALRQQRHHKAPQPRSCPSIANRESRIATLTPSFVTFLHHPSHQTTPLHTNLVL